MKKKILLISGSSREESTNIIFLRSLKGLYPNFDFFFSDQITKLPVFQAHLDSNPLPHSVIEWRREVQKADTVIVCTPEYIYNLPALLKNGLEWITSSGELSKKPTLAITLTPNPPRGEKAMQSLLWSLTALEANIIASTALYLNEIYDKDGKLTKNSRELVLEMLNLLS